MSITYSGTTVGLTYDALGRMVEQNRNGAYTQVVYGPGGGKLALMNGQTLEKAFVPLPGGATAVYAGATPGGPPGYVYCADENGYCAFSGTYQVAYGANGTFVYQTLSNGTPCNNTVFGNPLYGTVKACYLPGPILAYYRHADWLGTSRLASTTSRGIYYDGAYAPFGESYAETGTRDRSFTGQNQDTVSGLYDFLYREYHPVGGRWISPDPAGLAAVDPSNPQSWNRYAYVMNTPTVLVDRLGLNRAPDLSAVLSGCAGLYMNGFYLGPICGVPSSGEGPEGGGGGGGGDGIGISISIGGGGVSIGISEWPSGGLPVPGVPFPVPVPPLLPTIWEDLLGLPSWPTMADVGCYPFCDSNKDFSAAMVGNEFSCFACKTSCHAKYDLETGAVTVVNVMDTILFSNWMLPGASWGGKLPTRELYASSKRNEVSCLNKCYRAQCRGTEGETPPFVGPN